MGCQTGNQGGNESLRYLKGHHWGQRDSFQPPCGPVYNDEEICETVEGWQGSHPVYVNVVEPPLRHGELCQGGPWYGGSIQRIGSPCRGKPKPLCLSWGRARQTNQFLRRLLAWVREAIHSFENFWQGQQAMADLWKHHTAVWCWLNRGHVLQLQLGDCQACTSWRPTRPIRRLGLLPCECSQSLSGWPLQ